MKLTDTQQKEFAKQNKKVDFAWLCDVRGIIYPVKEGCPTIGGGYKVVYFDDFKVLAVWSNGQWKLKNKVFPLSFPGGVYGMAKSLGV